MATGVKLRTGGEVGSLVLIGIDVGVEVVGKTTGVGLGDVGSLEFIEVGMGESLEGGGQTMVSSGIDCSVRIGIEKT